MTQPTLLYDGHCNFCRRQAARIQDLTKGKLKLVSFRDPGAVERIPGLTMEQCESSIHLVMPDGKVYAGAAATAEALGINPELRWVARFYWIPGVRQMSEAAYRWVSRNRWRFHANCNDGKCAHASKP